MRWPFNRRADPVHAWGALTVAVGIAAVIGTDLATLHANEANYRWWWPTNWMAVPAGIFVVGLLLLFVPLASAPSSRAAIWRISRFEQRYRRFVQGGNTRLVDTKGLVTVGPHTPELDDVFVDVSLVRRPPQDVPTGPLDDTLTAYNERLPLEKLIGTSDPRVLAIVGGPGTGKTTLLHYTARHARQRHRRQHLPVLLYLREHSSTIIRQPDVGLADLIRNAIGTLKVNEPPEWFEQKLRNGKCVVLLDGLDEIPENQDRKVIATWIERQIQQYQDNHYIVTSRPLGYRTARIGPAEVVQVRPFTTEQVERFVVGWYRETERFSTGAEGEGVKSQASDLLRRLAASPELSDLAANPLLLTMIVYVHRFGGPLPEGRAALYGQICKVMLSLRQDDKNLDSKFTNQAKETILSGLAYRMMTKRVSRGIPREEILNQFKLAMRRFSKEAKAEDALAEVGTNGLIVEGESGRYRFAHHTFQEYMAASHIRAKREVHVLANSVDDPWWRETSLLYAALEDADVDAIVEACLESRSASALGLAFDCASQGSNLSPALRHSLEKLLAGIFELDSDQDSRRLISRALIMRHLHQQVRIRDSSLVWTRPITANLYLLYVADVERSVSSVSIRSDWYDQTPELGMRGSDAIGFVRWLNRIIGERRGYRLPRPSEVSVAVMHRLVPDSADGNINNCVWAVSEQASPPELWVPPGTSHPYAIKRQDLLTHVISDFAQSRQVLITFVLLRSILTARLLTRHLERDFGSHPSGVTGMAEKLSKDLISWPASDLDVSEAHERARTIRDFCDHEAKRTYSAKIVRILDILRFLPRRRARDLTSQLARNLDFDLALVNELGITLASDAIAAKDGTSNTKYILALDRFRDLLIGGENEIDRVLDGDHSGVLGNFPDANQVMSKVLPFAFVQALAIPTNSKNWLRDASNRFANASIFGKTEIGVSETFLAEAVPGRSDSEAAPDISNPEGSISEEILIRSHYPGVPPVDFPIRPAHTDSSPHLKEPVMKRKTGAVISRRTSAIQDDASIKSEEIIFPDGLADVLREAVRDICQLAGGGRNKGIRGQAQGREAWISDISNRLLEQAIPAFENETSVEREVFVGIRLAALCLAAEALALGEVELGAKFGKIAAGITVLERRSSGAVPVAEMIVLVPE